MAKVETVPSLKRVGWGHYEQVAFRLGQVSK